MTCAVGVVRLLQFLKRAVHRCQQMFQCTHRRQGRLGNLLSWKFLCKPMQPFYPHTDGERNIPCRFALWILLLVVLWKISPHL